MNKEAITGSVDRNGLSRRLRRELEIPSPFDLEVVDTPGSDSLSRIRLTLEGKGAREFELPRPVDELSDDDLEKLKAAIRGSARPAGFFSRGLVRLLGWWVIFAGSLTVFSVCPICGRMGCVTGIGIYGIMAGLLALAKQYGKSMLDRLAGFIRG